ncbi:Hypothetical predicted protein [Paramuricea clavata]|uniref:Uncharacterized protein n=1 Tax=Paramuricea clavata TaxID=317549 RepID=A0A6S7LG25_PARCT|nr:Hypothetical predicted protein [Paramuricea clavata]
MIPDNVNLAKIKQHNLCLASMLYGIGYKPIASYDAKPHYKYKNIDYDYNKCIDYLNQSNSLNTTVSIIVDDGLFVLDVDTYDDIAKLTLISAKHECKSNLVVKTRNGYHVYYNVDYDVKSQNTNNSNNSIATKCNGMPIIAPYAFRYCRGWCYKPTKTIVNRNRLNYLPYDMYLEISRQKNTCKSCSSIVTNNANFNNKPIKYYLSKLDSSVFLFGDRIVWLRLLSACKATGDDRAYRECLDWSRQGKYIAMTDREFKAQWNSANGISNGYAYLTKIARS